MSKKRGLSLEEKRSRMLDLFHEKKQCYQLKELEKLASKEKGITSMSVKDVLQSLVDDGMVDSERIGTSNYFWALPSKVANISRRRVRELEERLENVQQKKVRLSEQLTQAQVGREDTEQRSSLLTNLDERREQKLKLEKELLKYQSCDPQHLAELRKKTIVAKGAANRWTENVFAIKSWCKTRFSFEEERINQQFGIPEDLDYL